MQSVHNPPTLVSASIRAICLAIIRANVRWRRLGEVRAILQRELNQWRDVPRAIKATIIDALNEALSEIQRWSKCKTEKQAIPAVTKNVHISTASIPASVGPVSGSIRLVLNSTEAVLVSTGPIPVSTGPVQCSTQPVQDSISQARLNGASTELY